VTARKTESGYALEAAIPWSLLSKLTGLAPQRPAAGMPLNFEVGVSDTTALIRCRKR